MRDLVAEGSCVLMERDQRFRVALERGESGLEVCVEIERIEIARAQLNRQRNIQVGERVGTRLRGPGSAAREAAERDRGMGHLWVSCNTCHDQLAFHGGYAHGMQMCVLCHQPQNADPVTGNTLDAKVFFHKIHMGASLPSVVAGGQYIPAVNSFGSFNYSTVVFPADPGDPRRCEVCHSQTTGAAQATAFLLNPTRAACGSCHDNVNFATGANHPGGIQSDDTLCTNCHIPQGELDFDASILGAHVAPTRGPDRLCTWKQANRILAGYGDGQAAEGPSAGHASLVGLKLAKERGWKAPEPEAKA